MPSTTPAESGLRIETMAALISPMSITTLLSEMEKEQRFIRRHDTARTVVPLLSWDTINALLERDVLTPNGPPPRLQLMRNGVPIPREFWFRAYSQPRIDVRALLGVLRQGATLVIDGINRAVSSLGRLCADLSLHLDAKVWMNAYLTFGKGSGFGVHFDEHDIFVLQVHGRKTWRFYEEREPLPLQELIAQHGIRQRATATAIAEETLTDGDLLYLPRGEWHSAANAAPATPSVHLSVGIRPVRGIDLIEALRQRAVANPLFRRDAPRLAGALAMAEYELALKATLGDLLAQLSLAALRSSDLEGDAQSPVSLTAMGDPDTQPVAQTRRFNLPLLSF